MRYRFARCVLDADRLELEVDGSPVAVQPKVLEVLLVLVRHAGRAVSKQELIDEVWPGVATTDASLNRCISLARKAVCDPGGDSSVIRTLWGRGYRIDVPVEVEADGGEMESMRAPVAIQESRARQRVRLGVLVLVLAGGFAWFGAPRPLPPHETLPAPIAANPAIAVLPFAVVGSPEEAALGTGVAEDILTRLAATPGLRVVASTSSFVFDGPDPDVREIRSRLAASHVLSGSLRREGNRLLVTAQLTDADSGATVWVDRFEGASSDLFSVQDKIASATARALHAEPSGAEWARPRPPVRVYEQYLRARHRMRLGTEAAQHEAIALLDAALAERPDYAAAHAQRAHAFVALWSNRNARLDHEWILLATAAARRAIELDPHDAEAQRALGDVLIAIRDWGGAETALRRALSLNPNDAHGHFLLANLLMMRGRLEEARPVVERGLELDPLSAKLHRSAGRLHFYLVEYERAAGLLQRGMELNPAEPDAPRLLANVYERLGDAGAAAEAYALSFPAAGRPFVRVANRLLGAKFSLRVLLWLDVLRTRDRCRSSPYYTSYALAYLGEQAWFFECLERSVDHHLWYLRSEPVFDPYREDPRFVSVLERSGL